MTFSAVTLGKAKADISFKKNLEHMLKQRPLDLKAIGKLFYQYGVYLDLLEPVDLPTITEEELETPETTSLLDQYMARVASPPEIELPPLEGFDMSKFPRASEFSERYAKIPGVEINPDVEETLTMSPIEIKAEET